MEFIICLMRQRCSASDVHAARGIAVDDRKRDRRPCRICPGSICGLPVQRHRWHSRRSRCSEVRLGVARTGVHNEVVVQSFAEQDVVRLGFVLVIAHDHDGISSVAFLVRRERELQVKEPTRLLSVGEYCERWNLNGCSLREVLRVEPRDRRQGRKDLDIRDYQRIASEVVEAILTDQLIAQCYLAEFLRNSYRSEIDRTSSELQVGFLR